MAFCPRCKKDVIFADAGHFRRCTVCGFQFELTEPAAERDSLEAAVMTVGHVLLRVILIAGAVILVGVGVLFASCALHF
jgi:uncharacterized protein (DUF983 family)